MLQKLNIIKKQSKNKFTRGRKVKIKGYKKAIITLKKRPKYWPNYRNLIMSLKSFKPYTKSTRGTVLIDRDGLWKGKPFKPLTSINNASRGRNNYGRITSRNHGGGHKQKYRLVDFYRRKFDSIGEIERIEYDPNRSCYIMLVKFDDGKKFYYLAPQKIKVGDKIQNGSNIEIKVGIVCLYKIFQLELIFKCWTTTWAGGKIARSAGTSVSISGVDGNCSLVKMTSGKKKLILVAWQLLGLSNPDQKNKIGKAGRSRWLGIRPHTRGVVKNPVDHPHGGGEGKSAGGRHLFHQQVNQLKD